MPTRCYLQAALRNEEGRLEEARESLEAARAAAEQIEAHIILWQILAALGDSEAAKEIVDAIAESISDKALQQTFLAYAASKLDR